MRVLIAVCLFVGFTTEVAVRDHNVTNEYQKRTLEPEAGNLPMIPVQQIVRVSFVVENSDRSDKTFTISGFVVDAKKGLIATSKGDLTNIKSVLVINGNNKSMSGKILGHEERSGVTIVKIIDSEHLHETKFVSGKEITVGDPVYNISNPILEHKASRHKLDMARINYSFCGPLEYECVFARKAFGFTPAVSQSHFGGAVYDDKSQVIGVIIGLWKSKDGLKQDTTAVTSIEGVLWIAQQLDMIVMYGHIIQV